MENAKPVQPTASQPRVTTSELNTRTDVPTLQYRVQGMQSNDRNPSMRSYGRMTRGCYECAIRRNDENDC